MSVCSCFKYLTTCQAGENPPVEPFTRLLAGQWSLHYPLLGNARSLVLPEEVQYLAKATRSISGHGWRCLAVGIKRKWVVPLKNKSVWTARREKSGMGCQPKRRWEVRLLPSAGTGRSNPLCVLQAVEPPG